MNDIKTILKRIQYLKTHADVPSWEEHVIDGIIHDVDVLVEQDQARHKIEQIRCLNRVGYDGRTPTDVWFYYKRILKVDPYSEDEGDIRYHQYVMLYAVSNRGGRKFIDDNDKSIAFKSLDVEIRIEKLISANALAWIANNLEPFATHFTDITDECTRLEHRRDGIKLKLPLDTIMVDDGKYNEVPASTTFDDWYGDIK